MWRVPAGRRIDIRGRLFYRWRYRLLAGRLIFSEGLRGCGLAARISGTLIVPFLFVSLSALGQGRRVTPNEEFTGDLVVRVRTMLGDPLTDPAIVQLSSVGTIPVITPTRNGGEAMFTGLSLGSYTVVVNAAGYQPNSEEVSLDIPGSTNVLVYMRLEGDEKKGSTATGPPTLAPHAQMEIQKGLQALRNDQLDEALDKFEHASRKAPGNPYPHYLLGVVWDRKSNSERARKEFEISVGLDPHNGVVQAALGDLLLRLKDWAASIRALEEALDNGAGTWETNWKLAWAYFNFRQFDKALAATDRALSLAKGKAPELDLLRAQALAALGREPDAATVLKKFLAEHPGHARAETARTLLQQLKESMPPVLLASSAAPPAVPDAAPAPPPHEERPSGAWMPADVESAAPPFEPETVCDQESGVKGAEKRAEALADDLDRCAATEHVEVAEVDSAGVMRIEQEQVYDFTASVQKWKGNLLLDESRQLRSKPAAWEVRWLTSGLAELAFVFHPYYANDFTLRCEGLTRWRGEPAWAIYFQQREDRPVRFRAYRIGERSYPVKIKGRALIGANNHQLVRIETDLMEPVKQIPLESEHLAIDYAPVQFKQRNTRLWLPLNAELFFHIRGHRYHYSHHLSGFSLFSVDTQQQTKSPK